MMIGYIISMTPKDIETEVNYYQKRHLSDNEEIKFVFDEAALFKTQQSITRKSVKPVHFKLIHFWIDLRTCYHHQG